MRRFLHAVRSVRLAQVVRHGQMSDLITEHQACRKFTISSVVHAKRGDPTSDNESDRSGRKKGFSERASDRLSATRRMESYPDRANSSNERQTRSMSQRRSSLIKDIRDGDANDKMSKKASGKFRSHRALNSVKHDKESHRFTLDLGGNDIAHIDYKSIGKNMIDMYHTEVPEHLRGRGIGKALAKGAFETALKNNFKIKVSCEYLEDYVKRFADEKYKKLIGK